MKYDFEKIIWPTPDVTGDEIQAPEPDLSVRIPARDPVLPQPGRTPMFKKILRLWRDVREHARDFVEYAEYLLGPGRGAEKKEFVREEILSQLEELEAERDLLPASIQPLVFKGIRLALNYAIERAVKELTEQGAINIPA